MEDKLISFITAQLAKEKGFKEPTDYYYTMGGCLGSDWKEGKPINYCKEFDHTLANVPTQSLLQRWLREKHNISVLISFINREDYRYYYFIHTCVNIENSNRICSLPFKGDNYEIVLEEGLIQALELVK